jgi:hypothetical protein
VDSKEEVADETDLERWTYSIIITIIIIKICGSGDLTQSLLHARQVLLSQSYTSNPCTRIKNLLNTQRELRNGVASPNPRARARLCLDSRTEGCGVGNFRNSSSLCLGTQQSSITWSLPVPGLAK